MRAMRRRYFAVQLALASSGCGLFGAPLSGYEPFGPGGTTSIAVGANHSCAVRDGAVRCWGEDTFGQLGDGAPNASTLAPTSVLTEQLSPLSGALGTVAHELGSCAVVSDGVACWGDNSAGQLGRNTTATAPTDASARVVGLSGAGIAIACGAYHCCAVLERDANGDHIQQASGFHYFMYPWEKFERIEGVTSCPTLP